MTQPVLLVGPLAHPALCAALGVQGEAERLPIRLAGGTRAGLARDGWPHLAEGEGQNAAICTPMTDALARYCAVFGLSPVVHPLGNLLGVAGGTGSEALPDWPAPDWPADLVVALAHDILALPADRPAEQIAARLPMMGVWAASRLRAAAGPVSGGSIVPRRAAGAVEVRDTRQPYAHFFAIEEWDLRHRHHDGGWSPVVNRAGFLAGDAVCVLPWDVRRDRVLLVEQFRFAPALRGDPQPWLLEPIAGRIDAGETPEQAARREAVEEAGLTIADLIPAVHHYPSPGMAGEFLYLYIAPTDLPDDAAGVFGLAEEAEDIRGHLIARADLTAMVMDGAITNGPLAMMALWLELRAADLSARLLR